MSKQTVIVESKTVGFGKSEKKVKGLNSALGGLATKAMGVAGAYFGARGIINALKSSLSLYADQQLAEVKLEAALGKTSLGLQKYASSLQKTTRFGDELILQGMAQLAFFIKDEKQLKIATKATLDLASAKGMDLVQAADLVAKSVGSSTNALSRYGIAAVGAVGSQERLLSITNEIENLFGGQAVATTDSYQGAIDQLSNAFGDMQEVIGSKLAPVLQGFAESITDFLSSPMSEAIDDDRIAMEGLFDILNNSNTSMELREETINKINTAYGTYLPNLLTEQSSLNDIKFAHEAISNNLLQQIALEINREIIVEAMKKEAELRKEEPALLKAQTESRKDLLQAYKDQEAAQADLDSQTIEGFENQKRYKDDTIEFEKSLVSTTSSFDAMGFGIAKATRADRDATEALNENKKAREEIREEIRKENQAAIDLASAYGKLSADTETSSESADGFSMLLTDQEQKVLSLQDRIRELMELLGKPWVDESKKEWEAHTAAIQKNTAMGFAAASGSKTMAQAALDASKSALTGWIQTAIAEYLANQVKFFAWMPPPLNAIAIAGAAAAASTMFEQQISRVKTGAQYGFEGVVDEPTQFTVGEGGASEYVSVTPMEGVNNAGGGQGITVNISGNVMSEQFVEEELAERIQEAVRKGVDFGIS